jgi:Cu/Ag efflux protein CusF
VKAHPLVLVAALLSAASAAPAQSVGIKSSDATPCCAIVTIDFVKKIAAARDKAGKVFEFTVPDGAVLKGLRVGQSVSADFKTGKVTVHYGEPCCNIVRPAEPAAKVDLKPLEPCCGITAIDQATGVATAKETATGRVFRFEVRDAALLKSLKIGQKIFADFGSSKVRIHGSEPCCNIVGHGGRI